MATCKTCGSPITWTSSKDGRGGVRWIPVNPTGPNRNHQKTCKSAQSRRRAEQWEEAVTRAKEAHRERTNPSERNRETPLDRIAAASSSRCGYCGETIKWIGRRSYNANGTTHLQGCAKRPQSAVKSAMESLVQEARTRPASSVDDQALSHYALKAHERLVSAFLKEAPPQAAPGGGQADDDSPYTFWAESITEYRPLTKAERMSRGG